MLILDLNHFFLFQENVLLLKFYTVKNTLILLFLLLIFNSVAQNSEEKLIQLSGVVLADGTLDQLPYTTIIDLSTKKGTLSDYYGFFSLVVRPGDSLAFTSVGYKSGTYVVPDTLKDNWYSIIHVLKFDTVTLKEVVVYPWPSRENFAKAFVEMEPYTDAFQRAKQQLSGENLAFQAAKLQGDASLTYGTTQAQMYTQIYSHGQQPSNNLLNPYAWAKFIDEWKKGNLKRK